MPSDHDSDLGLVAILLDALATVSERDRAEVRPESSLRELGLDSLMITSVLLEIEDRLGAELPDELLARFADADEILVVADLINLVTGPGPGA